MGLILPDTMLHTMMEKFVNAFSHLMLKMHLKTLISLRVIFSLYIQFIDYGQVFIFMVFIRNQWSQLAHNTLPPPPAQIHPRSILEQRELRF